MYIYTHKHIYIYISLSFTWRCVSPSEIRSWRTLFSPRRRDTFACSHGPGRAAPELPAVEDGDIVAGAPRSTYTVYVYESG